MLNKFSFLTSKDIQTGQLLLSSFPKAHIPHIFHNTRPDPKVTYFSNRLFSSSLYYKIEKCFEEMRIQHFKMFLFYQQNSTNLTNLKRYQNKIGRITRSKQSTKFLYVILQKLNIGPPLTIQSLVLTILDWKKLKYLLSSLICS